MKNEKCKCGNVLAGHEENNQCDACYCKENDTKETAVKLHIYFQSEMSEAEVYEKLNELLKDEPFQVYDIDIQDK